MTDTSQPAARPDAPPASSAAASIAHDLTRSLLVALGRARCAREDFPSMDPVCDDLERVISATQRAYYLGGILQFLLAPAEPRPRPVDLNAVVREIRPRLHELRAGADDVALDLEPGLDPVMTDPGLLELLLFTMCLSRPRTRSRGPLFVATGRADGAAFLSLRGPLEQREAGRAEALRKAGMHRELAAHVAARLGVPLDVGPVGNDLVQRCGFPFA